MARADFINTFKNINIGGKNHVAYADTALVKEFTNRYIVNNTLNIKCVILICSIETVNTDLHRVCLMEFPIKLYYKSKSRQD